MVKHKNLNLMCSNYLPTHPPPPQDPLSNTLQSGVAQGRSCLREALGASLEKAGSLGRLSVVLGPRIIAQPEVVTSDL